MLPTFVFGAFLGVWFWLRRQRRKQQTPPPFPVLAMEQLRASHAAMQTRLEEMARTLAAMEEGRRIDQDVLRITLQREARSQRALEAVLAHFGVSAEAIQTVLDEVEKEL